MGTFSPEFELWVWSGDFGLPTIFPDCLRVVTYLKILGKPFKLVEKHNPLLTPQKTLPFFKHGLVEINNADEIIDYLTQKFPIDSDISIKNQYEAYAYENYTKFSLYPCLKYAWWVDEKNYDETTRSWFAKSITIPFNFYYPAQFQKRAQEEVEIVYGDHLEETELYHKIYKMADSFFKNISVRLGRNDYFFGSFLTSIDATLYAYLAPILKFPLVNPTMSNHLRSYENLVKYIQRITRLFYSDLEKKYIDAQEKKKISQHQSELQKKSAYKIQHKIIAVAIAALAMFGFAKSNGLLGKNVADNSADYNIFEPDDDYKL